MKQESKRGHGHYWVVFEDREQVAYYYGGGWQITGCLGFLKDQDFQEIDERKIERTENN